MRRLGTMRPHALLLLLCACGPAASMPASELAEKVALVRTGGYLGWPAEPAPHDSAGPHGGQVRTFVNPPLFESLKLASTNHPSGSVVVKELYSGGKVTGWAVDWKGDDGQWRFFEGFEPALDQYFYTGTDNLCANCHRGGLDHVLTKPDALRDAGM